MSIMIVAYISRRYAETAVRAAFSAGPEGHLATRVIHFVFETFRDPEGTDEKPGKCSSQPILVSAGCKRNFLLESRCCRSRRVLYGEI
jgi:hypothetical protein